MDNNDPSHRLSNDKGAGSMMEMARNSNSKNKGQKLNGKNSASNAPTGVA